MGMEGSCCRALATGLHLPFKGFTAVPPTALLLIILLSSVSTHFSQESLRDFSLLLSSVKMGFFVVCFFFLPLNIAVSETPPNYHVFQPHQIPFFSLPFR